MSDPGPQARLLADGHRLHLQHGPIDLIIEAWGEPAEIARAYGQAKDCFAGVLAGLAPELPWLRAPVEVQPVTVQGPVARRMVAAAWMHAGVFVTPMAGVAGAVADEVLEALLAGRDLSRAYVNNGGDIALHLRPGERFELGLVKRVSDAHIDGHMTLAADGPVRGVATSGCGGRSFSLGVADAVTVLAANAAAADVAATLIANAVDVEHPAVARRRACDIDPDSDLGERLVTVSVGELSPEAVAFALGEGMTLARDIRARGLIEAAVLCLAGEVRLVADEDEGVTLRLS